MFWPPRRDASPEAGMPMAAELKVLEVILSATAGVDWLKDAQVYRERRNASKIDPTGTCDQAAEERERVERCRSR